MKRPIRLGLAAALAAAFTLGAPDASAFSYVMMDDEALLERAQGVARVTVQKALKAADGDNTTRYVVQVEETLRGTPLAPIEILALPGTWNAPNYNTVVPGIPQLEAGETFLLFYDRARSGALAATELTLGLFKERTTREGRFYVRTVDDEAAPKGINAKYAALRDAAAFENWVRERSLGLDARDDYLVARTEAKYSRLNFGSEGSPIYARWYQFANGDSLPWRISQTPQAGVALGTLVDQTTAALAAWSGDPGSNILAHYAGTSATNVADACASATTLTLGTAADPCFLGKVTWNRELTDGDCGGPSSPSGPYACSGGVLAVGGISASFLPGDVDYRARKGFVCIRATTAGCNYMSGNGNKDGAELLTHEIGHSLGFGHSNVADAIMRANAYGNRGARLGSDDSAGAAAVYPLPPGANIGPTIAPLSPANNSTTSLGGGGLVGSTVTGSISFSVSGGSGSGTTNLVCNGSGAVSVTSGSPQNGIGVGGAVTNVGVRITLTAAPQSGAVTCTATPQGGSVANYTFNFTASAGVIACTGNCVFRNGFE